MPYDGLRTWSRRLALVTAAVSLITLAAPGNSTAYIEDESIKMPPTSGDYAYGVYGPNKTGFPEIGPIYNTAGDPVFGGKVRRITTEFPKPSNSDIYSKNGFWSADGKLMFHNTMSEKTIINTVTGATVDVPGDYKGFDGSFAPNDPVGGPYTWYFFSGAKLMKYSISIVAQLVADGPTLVADGPTQVTDFKVFRARALGGLGGSVDWIDNSGAHMVLNLDGKVRVYNSASDTLYSGSVGATGADWIGISPDGGYVVTSTDKGFYSYKITHDAAKGTGTLSTKGILFWTLCGGHGDLVKASNGQTYMVTFDCYGEGETDPPYDMPAVYAVNVAPKASVSGRTKSGRMAQRIGSTEKPNKRLFQLTWAESGDGHVSGVSTGGLSDWAFVSIESSDDAFGVAVDTFWDRPYMQEIVMVNVVTCQVLRVAHHRSRSVSESYYYQPRVSASWDGATAAWASNFGQLGEDGKPYPGYADIYAVDIAPGDLPSLPKGTTDVCIIP